MVLLALSIVREPMLPTVLMALAATAEQADTNQSTLRKEGYAVLELCSSLSALLQRIQPALGTQNQAALDLLAELGLTRRRAGVLERALFAVIQRLTRPGEPLPVHRITTTTGAPENKLLTQHKSLIQNSLGESPAALTGTLTTPHYGP